MSTFTMSPSHSSRLLQQVKRAQRRLAAPISVNSLIGNPVCDDVVHTRAARLRESLVVQWTGVCTMRHDHLMHKLVDVVRRAQCLHGSSVISIFLCGHEERRTHPLRDPLTRRPQNLRSELRRCPKRPLVLASQLYETFRTPFTVVPSLVRPELLEGFRSRVRRTHDVLRDRSPGLVQDLVCIFCGTYHLVFPFVLDTDVVIMAGQCTPGRGGR